MFACKEPPDWIICIFYPTGFLRQNAQDGFYTLTARFGCDHSEVITRLLNDKSRHHRYIVSAKLKPALWKLLRERHASGADRFFLTLLVLLKRQRSEPSGKIPPRRATVSPENQRPSL
jgi:hypothetical protein